MSRSRNIALGEFLRTRRARLGPHDAGLPSDGGRRVPGLRREELARLAGVSPDYYARLEQGRQPTASPPVLAALSGALRLSSGERAHLYDLAGVADVATPEPPPRVVGRGVHRLVELLGDTPVIVRGQFSEVIAINPAGAFLFCDFNRLPARERNGLRWMLLAPRARELYGPGWRDAAAEMIGRLRLETGRGPVAPRAAQLIAELRAESELFRSVWADQHVSAWLHNGKTLYHPAYGAMDFSTELVTTHSAPGQTLVVLIPDDPATFQAAMRGVTPD